MLSKGQSIVSIQAEAAAKLERERKMLEREERIATAIPTSVDWKYIHGQGAYCDAMLDIEATNRAAIAELLVMIPPVPSGMFRDGCVAFRPLGSMGEKENKRLADNGATWKDVSGFTVISEQYPFHPVSVEWFTAVGEYILRVTVKVSGEYWNLREIYDVNYDQRRNIVSAKVRPAQNGTIKNFEYLKFSGEDKGDNRMVFYWTPETSFADIFR